jgi:hypothetical protein
MGLQTTGDAETNTGAVGMDEDFVGLGSVEFVMAGAIAEVEALEPASLKKARRRNDWPKWDEAIKVELDVLKKAGTWGVVERPRGWNIVASKWVFRIKKDAASKIKHYKA